MRPQHGLCGADMHTWLPRRHCVKEVVCPASNTYGNVWSCVHTVMSYRLRMSSCYAARDFFTVATYVLHSRTVNPSLQCVLNMCLSADDVRSPCMYVALAHSERNITVTCECSVCVYMCRVSRTMSRSFRARHSSHQARLFLATFMT